MAVPGEQQGLSYLANPANQCVVACGKICTVGIVHWNTTQKFN